MIVLFDHNPLPNQHLSDIAIQQYGSMSGLKMLIDDNPSMFMYGSDGVPPSQVKVRPNVTDMYDIVPSNVRAMRTLGINIATYSTPPVVTQCGLINISQFSPSPAQIDGGTGEFLQIVVELTSPQYVIEKILSYTGIATVYNDSTNAGVVGCWGIVSPSGQSITFEDAFAPTYLTPGLYRFEVLLEVKGFSGSVCNFLYTTYFNV